MIEVRDALLHRIAHTTKMLLIGAAFLTACYQISRIDFTHHFPIKNVAVYGVNRVNREELQTLVLPLVDKGFFTINVEYIRDRLLQMPWVSYTAVRRSWPDKLEIILIEQKPVAKWNGESLLSEAGQLFSPKEETYPEGLAIFKGPEGKQVLMLEYFNEMNKIFSAVHAKVVTLELTSSFMWKLVLDNGIVLHAGYKDVLTKLDHFVKVYPKIIGERIADVEYVDLRYANGVAVRFKNQEGI